MKPADEALELTRMLAEERAELAEPVALLRERGPDAAELASLASRLALQGIDVTPKPVSGTPKPWKKWPIWGGGGAAVVLAWLALRAPHADPAAAKAAIASGQPAAARAVDAPSTATSTHAVAAAPGLAARAVPTPIAAASAEPRQEASPSATATSTSVSEPGASIAPLLPPERKTTASSAAARSEVEQRVGGQRAASAPPGASSAGSSSNVGQAPPTEIQLLRDARLALRQSPAAALSLTEQHARLYPQGKLVQERELIAISALVALGRRTAALSRGARFDAAYPTSAYRKQIGELLQ